MARVKAHDALQRYLPSVAGRQDNRGDVSLGLCFRRIRAVGDDDRIGPVVRESFDDASVKPLPDRGVHVLHRCAKTWVRRERVVELKGIEPITCACIGAGRRLRLLRPPRFAIFDRPLREDHVAVTGSLSCWLFHLSQSLSRGGGITAETRIGIHIGDVVEESDGDLMGDGVNIAARLEGVAQPGAICLSEDAYR